ncbi:MAG: hypothetical protein GX928_06215 [Ruminococcaceae bacterium]|nr:hypothetical protein [Oscillospiraceae bacterium]
MATAIVVAAKFAMSSLPNIEPVTLLFILYTKHLKKKTLYVIYVFTLIEGIIYGFHIWWITYLYVWTLLYIFVSHAKGEGVLYYASIGGIFGLIFGTLTSIPYFFIGGIAGGIAYISAGIVFDLVHAAGNFIIIALLYKPLDYALERIVEKSFDN